MPKLGSYHFSQGVNLLVMAGRQFFLVHPFTFVKKILVNPFDYRKKIWSPILGLRKNSGPPLLKEHPPHINNIGGSNKKKRNNFGPPSLILENSGPLLWPSEITTGPPYEHPKYLGPPNRCPSLQVKMVGS